MGRRPLLVYIFLLPACTRAAIVLLPMSGVSTEPDFTSPTVLDITDSSGNHFDPTGENLPTMRVSTSFRIAFSEPMNLETVTSETIKIFCGAEDFSNTEVRVDTTVSAATDTDGISDNEFVVTPDAPLPPVTLCSFGIEGGGDGVKDQVGNPLDSGMEGEGDLSYQFNTGCTSSDDFDPPPFTVTQSSCYQFGSVGKVASSQEEIENDENRDWITGINTVLVFHMGNTPRVVEEGFDTVPSIAKQVEGDFSADIRLFETIVDSTLAKGGLAVVPTMDQEFENLFLCFTTPSQCEVRAISDGSVESRGEDAACEFQGGLDLSSSESDIWGSRITSSAQFFPDLSLRIVRNGSLFQCLRKLPGGDFVLVGNEVSLPDLPESIFFAIFVDNPTGNNSNGHGWDDLTFNIGSAVGQD